MNCKTTAIVLHLTPHNEKSSVLHLYTRSHGRMQYLVYGLSARRNRGLKSMLEPLSVLQIEAVHQDTRSIQQLRECTLSYIPQALSTDMNRRCVALFISEILFRTLTHPLQDEPMYDFLEKTVADLDTCSDPENAHLRFLVGYADELGFGIDFAQPENSFLATLLSDNQETIGQGRRKALLHALIDYYTTHIPDFQPPKSLAILEEIYA